MTKNVETGFGLKHVLALVVGASLVAACSAEQGEPAAGNASGKKFPIVLGWWPTLNPFCRYVYYDKNAASRAAYMTIRAALGAGGCVGARAYCNGLPAGGIISTSSPRALCHTAVGAYCP